MKLIKHLLPITCNKYPLFTCFNDLKVWHRDGCAYSVSSKFANFSKKLLSLIKKLMFKQSFKEFIVLKDKQLIVFKQFRKE